MISESTRRSYMEYWHFTKEEKEALIRKLTVALPMLRASVQASQEEISNAIGVSRQTYNAIESQKRQMSWNTYMALILFFDYNPASHNTIRQLDAFPNRLDECWLTGKISQIGGEI